MDGYEINKYFGAICGALLIYFSVSFLAEAIYEPGHGHGGEGKLAFQMAIDDAPTPETDPVEVDDVAAMMATAEMSAGEKIFGKKCASCHSAESGGANKVGPALYGVVGNDIGANDDYRYSSAMADKGGVWGWEELNGFLKKPKEWLPGTKMSFVGLKKLEDRAAVMAWLNEQSGAPLSMPVE